MRGGDDPSRFLSAAGKENSLMNFGDILVYLADIVLLYILFRFLRHSRAIHIRTSIGPQWMIPVIFWAVAALCFFNYTGVFRWIQTIVFLLAGGLYMRIDSGLSPRGIVMFGRLHPYEKTFPIRIDDRHHCVYFTMGKAKVPVYFLPEEMTEVRAYLTKHARAAKRAKDRADAERAEARRNTKEKFLSAGSDLLAKGKQALRPRTEMKDETSGNEE